MKNKMATKQAVLPVIIARMGSSRLPGKVLQQMLDGESVIERIVEQVSLLKKNNGGISEPIVATSTLVEEEPILRLCESVGVEVFAGPQMPLLRMSSIAEERTETWLWRLNADSPLILFPLIQHAVEMLPELDQSCVAVSNLGKRTFPYGISLELYRSDWLKKIGRSSLTEGEKEHITPLQQQLPENAIRGIVASDLAVSDFDPSVRLTIDYNDDAKFFHSLWQLEEFNNTEAGSMGRTKLAYEKRLSHEI